MQRCTLMKSRGVPAATHAVKLMHRAPISKRKPRARQAGIIRQFRIKE